jgi:uncharacterized membrane protein YecN with MAPEG domain
MLPITSLYAGLLALLFIALSARVIAFRRSERVSLGDGESKDLRQRCRAHANFAEYTPIGLILLACVELQAAPGIAVHLLGLMLLIGRGLHARAFWIHPMNFTFRTWGMLLTFGMIGLSAIGLVLHGLF